MGGRNALSWWRRLGRMAASAVPTGTPVPILRGPLRGGRWIAGAASGPGGGLSVAVGLCEPRQLAAAGRLTSAGGVCFDVGANVGLYSLLFARTVARVFAFEPVPRNIAFLARTLAANRVRNVTIVPMAVSDVSELADFGGWADWSTGGLVTAGAGAQPVATVSLDDFASRYGVTPDLLKIDVEGAEHAVLRGAIGLLGTRKPPILLSIHGPGPRRDCLALLRTFGYTQVTPLDTPSRETATEYAIATE
jgi:FkbM family methyltransferase